MVEQGLFLVLQEHPFNMLVEEEAVVEIKTPMLLVMAWLVVVLVVHQVVRFPFQMVKQDLPTLVAVVAAH